MRQVPVAEVEGEVPNSQEDMLLHDVPGRNANQDAMDCHHPST